MTLGSLLFYKYHRDGYIPDMTRVLVRKYKYTYCRIRNRRGYTAIEIMIFPTNPMCIQDAMFIVFFINFKLLNYFKLLGVLFKLFFFIVFSLLNVFYFNEIANLSVYSNLPFTSQNSHLIKVLLFPTRIFIPNFIANFSTSFYSKKQN